MKDGRMTVYYNQEERKLWDKEIKSLLERDLRFRNSEGEFVRYCIRWTLAHDKSLKGN